MLRVLQEQPPLGRSYTTDNETSYSVPHPASKQLQPWRNHGDRTLKQIRFHYPQLTDIGKPSAQGACSKSRYNTTPLVTLYASPTSLVAEPTRDTTSTP